MTTVEAPVAVDATADAVWAVLSDTQAWPTWSDVLVALDGPREVGAPQRLRLRMVGGLPLRTTVVLTAWEPGRRLEWRGGVPGLFVAQHGFGIEPAEVGVRLVHYERFTGVLAALLAPLLRRLLPRHERVARDLGRVAESRSG